MAQKRRRKKARGREAGIAPEDLAGFFWDKDEPRLWEAGCKAVENPDDGILDPISPLQAPSFMSGLSGYKEG